LGAGRVGSASPSPAAAAPPAPAQTSRRVCRRHASATPRPKLEAQPSLADSGLAEDADNVPPPLRYVRQLAFEHLELSVTPDQRQETLAAAKDVAGDGIKAADQLGDRNRRCDAAHGVNAERVRLDELLGAGIGVPADQDRPGLRHVLQAIGEMHIRARRIVGLVHAVFDDLDDDLADVKPHAYLQVLIEKTRDRVLHRQCAQAATNRMILVRHGSPEQRHDAVALHLVDDALITMDGILHEVQHRIEALHRKLGITKAVDQPRRIADVGKQHGQALALATLAAQTLQRALGGLIRKHARP